MRRYVGPKGYGSTPEIGGSSQQGRNRMRSLEPLDERLTAAVKDRILKEFEPFNADVKKIDKDGRGCVRIWYNNDDNLYTGE